MSLMNVSRVSFGEVQRSLAGIKSYAQVACAELFRHSVHRRQVEVGPGRTALALVAKCRTPVIPRTVSAVIEIASPHCSMERSVLKVSPLGLYAVRLARRNAPRLGR